MALTTQDLEEPAIARDFPLADALNQHTSSDSTLPPFSVAGQITPTVPSLTAAVVTPQGILRTCAAGYADLGSRQIATPETAYAWFSMTKLVTATAIVQLCEKGELALDAPIVKFNDCFKILRPRKWAERITIRHLLTHSSGMPNPLPIRWVHPVDHTAPDVHSFVGQLLERHGKLAFEPGSTARYSNIGYALLGEIIASVSGKDYMEYVRSQILGPLAMSRTDFSYTEDMGTAVATGYHSRWNVTTPFMRLLLPTGIMGEPTGRLVALNRFYVDGPAYGGLIGSVDDAARFLQAHLCGDSDCVQVLSTDSTSLMRHVDIMGKGRDFGLGWNRPTKRTSSAEPFVEHLGGGGGFWCVMRIYPGIELGLVVMGNVTSYNHDAVIHSLIEQWRKGNR
jgi:CubicO group peptidase (beta-lactamase class C family)